MLESQRASWATFASTMNGLLDTKSRPQPVRTIGEK
jgi:hypothetical protein